MIQNTINYIDKQFQVQITSNEVYTTAGIHFSTQPAQRNLLIDIYQPIRNDRRYEGKHL